MPTGTRTFAKNPLFFEVFENERTESGTFFTLALLATLLADLLYDPDLQFLLENWPKLLESIRTGIVEIIRRSVDE